MRCALVVGHKESSPGAENKAAKITEYEFNNEFVKHIEHFFRKSGQVELTVVHRDMYAKLPHDINKLHPQFVISLHCNAFNCIASGTEVLYWHKTRNGNILAKFLQDNIVNTLNIPDRGIKPRDLSSRGGGLLKRTNAPCVIAEPFFIDNSNDLGTALRRYDELVNAYIRTIYQFNKYLSGGCG